jgi:hypothetical protein
VTHPATVVRYARRMKVTDLDRRARRADPTTTQGASAPSATAAPTTAKTQGAAAPPALDDATRAQVGLDAPRREKTTTNAPSTSVRALQGAQIALARGGGPSAASVAAALVPDLVERTAQFLGAGTFGAVYDLGDGFVAKRLGDARSTMGALRDVFPPDHFAQTAKRQQVVHAALVDAGFPCVPAAVVESAPEWLVMKKATGVTFATLDAGEQALAHAACAALRDVIKAPVNDALQAMGYDLGGDVDTDVHVENATFARTPGGGIVVAEFFDPIV